MRIRSGQVRRIGVITMLTLGAGVAAGQCLPQEKDKISGTADDWFGSAIDTSGNAAIVGAPRIFDFFATGHATVLRHDGTQWAEEQSLIPQGAAMGAMFGISVCIEGDLAVVGAMTDMAGSIMSGAAYVFRYDGSTWIQQARLEPPMPDNLDFFGASVMIAGDAIMVGAAEDDDSAADAGCVYYYLPDGNGGWNLAAKILAPDAGPNDRLGWSMDASGDRLIVGAPGDNDGGPTWTGSAYVLNRVGTTWVMDEKLLPDDPNPNSPTRFGESVSIDGDAVVVSASGHSHAAYNSGAAYVFRHDGSAWNLEQELTVHDTFSQNVFGFSASISGDVIVAGAYLDAEQGDMAGAAYVFRHDGASWVEQAKMFASDALPGDMFGYDVITDGQSALISAYRSDDQGVDSGSVYAFDLNCPASCLADINNDGILDLADVTAFISAFLAQQPEADLAEPYGVHDLADLQVFVTSFVGGCP